MDAIALVLLAVSVIVAMAAKTLMSASLLALALTHLLQLSGSMQVRLTCSLVDLFHRTVSYVASDQFRSLLCDHASHKAISIVCSWLALISILCDSLHVAEPRTLHSDESFLMIVYCLQHVCVGFTLSVCSKPDI